MHHYPHHIGDFNAATRHLTRVERSLYRDAIELYYDKEKSLTGDFEVLCRRLMARSDEEKEGLRFVLSEFFEFIDGRYVHHRCEEEILAYHNNQTNKSKAGKASAEARRKRAEARRKKEKQQELTDVEQPLNSVEAEGQQNPTNQEPITNNQEPIKKHYGNDTRERFAMFPEWKPTFSELALVALRNANVSDQLIQSELPKYIACLIDKEGREHTQHEWTNLFKSSLIKIGLSSKHEKNTGTNGRGFNASTAIASAAIESYDPEDTF